MYLQITVKNVFLGPFTREEPNNPLKKSCLDLIIISKGLMKYLDELVVDVKNLFTPHRAVKGELIHTDHYSIFF